MTLAWLLFAFVGLFTARYMRQVWEPTKLLGEKAWFTVSNNGKDNNTQSLTLISDLDWHRPKVRRYTPSLNIVSQRLRLTINSALFYFLEKFTVKIRERLVD